MKTLGRRRAAVMAYLFATLPIREEVDTLDFALEGAPARRFHVACAKFLPEQEDDDVTVVVTLPDGPGGVFIGLTYRDEKTVARVLANLEEYEEENALRLAVGEAVVTPDPSIADGPYAVLLLRASSSEMFADLPDAVTLGEIAVGFRLVMPLTRDEYLYRKHHGQDALMDAFDRDGKDIAFFG